MSDPITSIRTQLASILQAITPPTGQPALTSSAAPPVNIEPLPFALITKRGMRIVDGMSFGQLNDAPLYRFDLSLLFAQEPYEYNEPNQVEWTSLVLHTLMADASLNGAAIECMVTDISFDPVGWNGQEYVATTYHLEITAES